MTPNVEQIIRSIQGLPPVEQERVRHWLDDEFPASGKNSILDHNTDHSELSLSWLNENRHEYVGQWVALDGNRLIANGQTAKEVYVKAKADGIKTPFVELVQENELVPFTGGWLS